MGVYAAPLGEAIGWSSAAGSMGISNAVASGMLGGAISGGIMGGTVKSALIGGATGGMFGAVGDAWPSGTENVLGHAGVGCASGLMSGSGCGSGAMAAGFSAAATPYINDWNVVGATMASAVIGGTASVLGGGKFENGAQTGAFGYLFNCRQHPGACTTEENRADLKAIRDEGNAQANTQINDAKQFVRGLTGFNGRAGLSNSLKVVSDGADYVTALAVAVPIAGEPVAIASSAVSLSSGLLSAGLSNDQIRNSAPNLAGEFVTRVSSTVGAGWRLATSLGQVAQKHWDSVVNP